MAYKKLSELTTRGQTWNIKVKVMRMWDSINFVTDELMSLDMIVMDEQGETIHATIWNNLIDTYRPNINESSIYVFSNFKVQESTKYRPVDNQLKITFMHNTKVKEVQGSSNKFQDYYFEFATRDTLLERLNKDQQLSDVIGLLTQIKPVGSRMMRRNTANPRPSDIREIDLIIPEGAKIRVTLWGQLAHCLSEDVIGNQTVVVVTSAIVEDFNGLSLKSTSATKLYKDLDIPETWKLIDRHSTEETVPRMMEVDKSTQGTLQEQMFYNRRTLRDITEMRQDSPANQDFMFTSKATIDQVQEDVKWWYMACKGCNKAVKKKTDKYHCDNCDKYPESTTPMYRIRLQISDHTSTISCTLFDEEAKNMLNTSASSLLDSLDGKSEEVPKIIQQLCGRTFIFRFKLNNQIFIKGTPNYAVKKTFVLDDKLETQYMKEKVVEDLMDDEVNTVLKQVTNKLNKPVKKKQNINHSPSKKESRSLVQLKEEPKDNDGTIYQEIYEEEISPSSELHCGNQRRRRSIIIEDDSEEECIEKSTLRKIETKVYSRKKKSADAKYTKMKEKAEEDLMDDEVDTVLKQVTNKLNKAVKKKQNNDDSPTKKGSNSFLQVKQEPEDNDGTIFNQEIYEEEISPSSELHSGNQRRRRSIIIEDDSEEVCTEKSTVRKIDTKVHSRKKKSADAKYTKTGLEDEDLDVEHAKRKSAVSAAIRAAKRLAKKVDGTKTRSVGAKRQKTCGQLEDQAYQTRPKRTRIMNRKYAD